MTKLAEFAANALYDVLRSIVILAAMIIVLFALSLATLRVHAGSAPMEHYQIETTGHAKPPSGNDGGIPVDSWIISQEQPTSPVLKPARNPQLRL